MKSQFTRTELKEIEEQLSEFAAGFSGFVSWARGEVVNEAAEGGQDLRWRAAFLAFAGKGRVETYRGVLEANRYEIDSFLSEMIKTTHQELDSWLNEAWNRVAADFEEAFPFLIEAYHKSYASKGKGMMGRNFDDFLDERDLLEFFVIGVGDVFPTTEFCAHLFEEDCKVREVIAELGLENFEEEFFPGRIPWYPPRFWWHHRPEDRFPHPDSLET
jgi:hypothetical protein